MMYGRKERRRDWEVETGDRKRILDIEGMESGKDRGRDLRKRDTERLSCKRREIEYY